ncbi:E3 ubiquitin-protein ligase RNF34, partial [Armadillidium nasatum]
RIRFKAIFKVQYNILVGFDKPMAEKLSSNFFGCVNPCNIEWQKFLNDQTKLDKGNVIEKWFLNDMGECEECKAKFSLFRRKRLCCECGLSYCSSCLTRNNGRQRQCNKCTILSRWPVNIDEISSLRVRDLRHFLNSQKIKTDTIREKKDLVDLVAYHLKYRRGAVPSRRSQDFQTENNISSTRPSNNAPRPSVLRDDGIRVRPLNTINTEGDSSGYCGVASSSTDCESSGIRVFASSNNQNPNEVAENQDSSDDTSSDWSFLLSDLGPERSPADSSSVTPNTESEASVSHSNNLTDNRSASGVDEDSNNLTENRRASGVEDVNIYPNLENLEIIPGENPENMQTEDSENPQMEEPESSQNENHENNQNENLEHIYSEMIQNDPPRNQPSPSINLPLPLML